MSTYVSVVISPATTTSPVVISVSQATRPWESAARTASSTESEIWSAILSGWPSVTDSEVKENERFATAAKRTCRGRRLLRRRLASHELLDEVGERLAREHPADAFCDRQLDSQRMRDARGNRRGRQALDHHPDLGNRLVGRRALGDQLSRTPVPPRR